MAHHGVSLEMGDASSDVWGCVVQIRIKGVR